MVGRHRKAHVVGTQPTTISMKVAFGVGVTVGLMFLLSARYWSFSAGLDVGVETDSFIVANCVVALSASALSFITNSAVFPLNLHRDAIGYGLDCIF